MLPPPMAVLVALLLGSAATGDAGMTPQPSARVIPLPEPDREGEVSVEAALSGRKSVREYSAQPLTIAELSQLLWAAQGVTHAGGRRTAPSAGATYPIEVYVVAGAVQGLEPGLYQYRIGRHELVERGRDDLRAPLAVAALGQDWVETAAAVIVIAGVIDRTAARYGQRAVRYVHMEVGAVAENLYLQAAALGLGTVFVGAFSDTRVKSVLKLPEDEDPFAIMPVGRM